MDKNNKKKIISLNDLKEEKKEESNNEINWFTGGERSGLQVQAPKKKEDIIENIFQNAKKFTTENVSEKEKENNSFMGVGYRLGQINNMNPIPIIKNSPNELKHKITIWKNGFTVDDGPLRQLNDPNNQKFLNSINQGIIPQELQNKYNKEIHVDLIDKRNEEWKEPPKILKPFSGVGQVLQSSSTNTSSINNNNNMFINSKIQPVNIDEMQPTTSIQIRLVDGTRLVTKFNYFHKISDIRNYINSIKTCNFEYDLMISFPQKLLIDENQTIKDAGLINSVIIQKKK